MEKYTANSTQKRAIVAILMWDEIDFRTKVVTRDKEGYFIMIKKSVYYEYIKCINILSPNNRALRYMK